MSVRLSDSEWKIINLLWEEAPRTITQLTAGLKEATGWTKHTVMTLLKRMEEKGAVHYEEGAKAKLYYPDVAREETVLQETEEFLDKVYHGRLGLLVNTMIAQNAVSKEELEELYTILREAEQGGK
ncbi:MAG: BlaI/MecI/CopY family transcriptional regulator [Roseburia sp.]